MQQTRQRFHSAWRYGSWIGEEYERTCRFCAELFSDEDEPDKELYRVLTSRSQRTIGSEDPFFFDYFFCGSFTRIPETMCEHASHLCPTLFNFKSCRTEQYNAASHIVRHTYEIYKDILFWNNAIKCNTVTPAHFEQGVLSTNHPFEFPATNPGRMSTLRMSNSEPRSQVAPAGRCSKMSSCWRRLYGFARYLLVGEDYMGTKDAFWFEMNITKKLFL